MRVCQRPHLPKTSSPQVSLTTATSGGGLPGRARVGGCCRVTGWCLSARPAKHPTVNSHKVRRLLCPASTAVFSHHSPVHQCRMLMCTTAVFHEACPPRWLPAIRPSGRCPFSRGGDGHLSPAACVQPQRPRTLPPLKPNFASASHHCAFILGQPLHFSCFEHKFAPSPMPFPGSYCPNQTRITRQSTDNQRPDSSSPCTPWLPTHHSPPHCLCCRSSN